MYYITNHNNQIIAIDPNLMLLLGVENVEEFYKGVALEEIKISLIDEKVTIKTTQIEETYTIKNHPLSSFLGDITLVQVQPSSEKSILEDDNHSMSSLTEESKETVADLIGVNTNTISNIFPPKDKLPEENILFLGEEEKEILPSEDDLSENNILFLGKTEKKREKEILPPEDNILFIGKAEEKTEKEVLPLEDDLISIDDLPEDDILFSDETKESVEKEVSPLEDDLISIKDIDDLPEDDILFLDETKESVEKEVSPLEDDLISIKDIVDLPEDDILFSDETKESVEKESSTETFDLILNDIPDIEKEDDTFFDFNNESNTANDEIPLTENKPVEIDSEQKTPITIDIETISKNIGISPEDYNVFLNEYIDTAFSLEKDLQSTQDEKRSQAADTLSHLSNVLHLPLVSDIITQIKNTTPTDQNNYIESFYATLARLSTSSKETPEEKSVPVLEIDSEIKNVTAHDPIAIDIVNVEKEIEIEIEEVVVAKEEPAIQTEVATKEEEPTIQKSEGFGTINLDDIKPIHFDFQLEQAANDLGLPIELIEEFVNDFIVQAREETEKMLKAYEEGDLDTIQKIGHLLKGTSSNLRIAPLADTLYEIQFCEDSSKLEKIIKFYWGHFLSLETQINLISK